MSGGAPSSGEVNRFILDHIDTVPHLECLLLLWTQRPARMTAGEVAKRLYVGDEIARKILQDLRQAELIVAVSGDPTQFGYESSSDQRDSLLTGVESTYRRELVRITNMIHSKASPAVREFAKSFRLKRGQD